MRKMEYAKFRRGQVWFLKEPEAETEKKINSSSSVQAKSRPYLIVSIDESNQHSNILNVVPLSLSADPNFVAHVSFTNEADRVQVIECEQIMTKSMYDFMQRGIYKYTLSESIMQQVAFKLARQIGADYAIPNLDALLKVIESLAVNKAQELNRVTQDTLDTAVLEIATRLEDLFTVSSKDIPDISKAHTILNEHQLDLREKELREMVEAAPKKETSPQTSPTPASAPKQRANAQWTPERKKEFLTYYENHDMIETAKKFEMSESSVYTYVSKFRKEVKL